MTFRSHLGTSLSPGREPVRVLLALQTTILATIDASASAWQSSSPPNAEPSGNA